MFESLTYVMRAQFLLNGEDKAYLIHGQPLEFEIKAERCLFLLIHYAGGNGLFRRWSLRRPHTRYRSVANCYATRLRVWGIGWGIRRLIDLPLHINFFNLIDIRMRCHTAAPERVMSPDINTSPVQIDSPNCRLASINFPTVPDRLSLKGNHLQLIPDHSV